MKRVFIIALALVLVMLAGCVSGGTQDTKTTFEQFEAGMDDAGFAYEKTTMAAAYIGALEGYKYEFISGGKVELYRFDPDSEALKNATINKSVFMEGFGSFPAEINGKMILLANDNESKDTISEIFNSIK